MNQERGFNDDDDDPNYREEINDLDLEEYNTLFDEDDIPPDGIFDDAYFYLKEDGDPEEELNDED